MPTQVKTVNYSQPAGIKSAPLIKPRPANEPIKNGGYTGYPSARPAQPVMAPSSAPQQSFRPFSSSASGTKRMFASGTVPASTFQNKTGLKPKASPEKPEIKTGGKTILPPKSFRSRRLSPAWAVTIIIILALVGAGLVGYFVFPDQLKTAYHQVLIAVGLEQSSPLTTVPSEQISTTPKIATLDDITFKETSDPASGTAINKGDRITYTLSLHNTAESNFENLSVSDPLPAGTERLTVLSTPTGAKDNSTESAVEISNISLAGGQNQQIRFQVTVKSDLAEGASITNTATLAMNGSRKVSNNNSPSSLSLAAAIVPTITPVPENTPVVTPTPTATPVPTVTPAATPTPTPVVTVTPTATAATTPVVTVAPEETADRAAPEDHTTVKTGGNSLTYLFVFMALTIIAGMALILVRRQESR